MLKNIHLKYLIIFKRMVLLFGTGNFGSLAKSALEQKKININFFIDNNLNNWGKNFEGKKLFQQKIF